MYKAVETNRGLVKMIILIVVALLIIAYFGINLRSIVDSPTFKSNWNFIKETSITVWDKYLEKPATYLWNIFVTMIWEPAIDNLGRIKDGQPDDFQLNAPKVSQPDAVPL